MAGGLNLYGFANGDPINFSDPFGLCPEEKRDEDGRCPGGLSVDEWDAVVNAIRTLSESLQGTLTQSLDEGRIRGGDFDGGTLAYVRNVAPGTMRLNRTSNLGSVFELASGDLGFVLAHEYDHQVVWGNMNLWSRFVGTYFTLLNPKVGRALERRADLFACTNSAPVSLAPPYIGSCPRP